MSDSVFYCYGIPVAIQRSDGILRGVELTTKDREFLEKRLSIPESPITFKVPEQNPETLICDTPALIESPGPLAAVSIV